MMAQVCNRKPGFALRCTASVAAAFGALAISLVLEPAGLHAQTRQSGPLDIRPAPLQGTSSGAPAVGGNPDASVAWPEPDPARDAQAGDTGSLVARPGVLIPGMRAVAPGAPRRGSRLQARLTHEVLARQVFMANAVDGKGSGFFLRTPDGVLRLLAVTPEKLRRIYFKTEVQRLALPLRKRQRIAGLRNARDREFGDYRMRRAGQGAPDRPRRLSEFFTDNSLKPGDVVVTTRGLQVFRGGGDVFPYTARHFTPLAQWRKLHGGEKRLDRIERELKRRP